MRRNYILMICITGLVVFAHCKKEKISELDCRRLQNSITTDDKDEVKIVIDKFIANLPPQTYSAQNVNNLVNAISQQCGTNALLICYDCIYTYPSQTEIKISYFSKWPVRKDH